METEKERKILKQCKTNSANNQNKAQTEIKQQP